MRIHSENPKPFKCDKCDRIFAQKKSLRDHSKVHTEETENKLSVEKSFRDESSLLETSYNNDCKLQVYSFKNEPIDVSSCDKSCLLET